jgi:hypothetical protein
MGGAVGVSILSAILFALLPHAGTAITSSLGSEHGMAHAAGLSGVDAHSVSFAFRATLLASALISLIAHVLAWIIPENTLRTGSASAATKEAGSSH